MELKNFLSMNGGDGDNSYAQNGRFVTILLDRTKSYIVEAIEDLLRETGPLNLLKAADLGCSCGPNVAVVMATIIGAVEEMRRKENKDPPEIQLLLNDLPTNDFNSVFRRLPSFLQQFAEKEDGGLSCFVMGVPGSFYGRLFPKNYVHFVHSLFAVHWLSQAPIELVNKEGEAINKGKIYISKTSPPSVWKAYLNQFDNDFSAFLKFRSQEMVVNGRMVLILHGRPNADAMAEDYHPWYFFSKALSELVSQGLLEERKLDEWNIPYYMASMEEVKDIVERESSFSIEKLEKLKIQRYDSDLNLWASAHKLAKNIRSFTEALIVQQFGENIAQLVYDRLVPLIVDELANKGTDVTSLIVVLKRK